MNESTHIVNKVFLELNTSSQDTAYLIKDKISSFLESDLFPELENILEKHDVNESVIRLNELSVDVEIDKWGNTALLKAEIAEAFRKKLEKVIPAIQFDGNGTERHEKVSPEINREQIFLFFLENGRLPWHAKEDHILQISQDETWKKSLENDEFVKKLKNILATEKFAVRRFVLQFPEEMYFAFLRVAENKFSDNDSLNLKKCSNQLSPTIQKRFHEWLIDLVVKKTDEVEFQLQKLRKIISGKKKQSPEFIKAFKSNVIPVLEKIQPDLLKNEKWKDFFESGGKEVVSEKLKDAGDKLFDDIEIERESDLSEKDEIYVSNAGLILLYPFLKSFFQKFKILDKNNQLPTNNKELAMQSLHYLATGREDFFEGNLAFEKFLSNVNQKWPIPRESLLNDQIKTEAESLLKAAITHWSALKNTSPDGLRQNFLQRDGKLIPNGDKYRLLVERKAYDILLDRLSWNISVVKLPWIEYLIHVEW